MGEVVAFLPFLTLFDYLLYIVIVFVAAYLIASRINNILVTTVEEPISGDPREAYQRIVRALYERGLVASTSEPRIETLTMVAEIGYAETIKPSIIIRIYAKPTIVYILALTLIAPPVGILVLALAILSDYTRINTVRELARTLRVTGG